MLDTKLYKSYQKITQEYSYYNCRNEKVNNICNAEIRIILCIVTNFLTVTGEETGQW